MKKQLAVLLVAFSLAGCAGGNFTSFLPNASIQNPISIDDFQKAKIAYASLGILVANYRELPLCKKSTPFSISNFCAKRSVIVKLQEYDAIAYDTLEKAEAYISSNQTLNLASVISAAKIAVQTYQDYAAKNGIKS